MQMLLFANEREAAMMSMESPNAPNFFMNIQDLCERHWFGYRTIKIAMDENTMRARHQ